MKAVNIMVKPASAACNLRCRYCFYAEVAALRKTATHAIMSEATVDAMLNSVRSELGYGDRVHFVFQGGEPTLAGIRFFRRFVSLVRLWENVSVTYALQTNALLLNGEWCDFLKESGFLVGISMDILPKAHDGARVLPGGEGTFELVAERLSLLKEYGVQFNILCTLTSEIARQPRAVWEQLEAMGIDYVQFTPCLGRLNVDEASDHSLTPRLFASFYTELFEYWYDGFKNGRRRSVKLFDDVVNQLLTGLPFACGMDGICRPQIVVEADGSVYPCDFYCLDRYKLGNITRQTVSELLASSAAERFTARWRNQPTVCEDCEYAHFCHGNCQRMQSVMCCSEGEDFCGYQCFLRRCGDTLRELARQARRSITDRERSR